MHGDDRVGASDGSPGEADEATYSLLAEQRMEIERLRRQLADTALEREVGEAILLTATAGTIATPVTHGQLLTMIVETAADVISARSAALFLLDEEAEELVFEVALGPKADEVRHHRVPVGHGIAGLVAMSGQPMAVSDASSDPRQASDIAQDVDYRPESILCVPLSYGDDVIGVLELLDKIGQPAFTAADIGTLGLFGNLAAVAITQSRAHGSLDALLSNILVSRGQQGVDRPEEQLLLVRSLVERLSGEEGGVFRETIELAELVQEIAWRGEREREACHVLLRGFADYLRHTPGGSIDAGGML